MSRYLQKGAMQVENLLALARQIGFSQTAPINMQALEVREAVREMCASDRCHSYGRSWSCPPACGTLEQCRDRIGKYGRGIFVQTTGRLEDDFDLDGLGVTQHRHKKSFDTLTRQVRMLYPGCLPLTAGACTLCRRCTYPNRPCRFPQKRFFSMEAFGLLVSDVCIESGLSYYYGPKTITYTSCILLDEKKGMV